MADEEDLATARQHAEGEAPDRVAGDLVLARARPRSSDGGVAQGQACAGPIDPSSIQKSRTMWCPEGHNVPNSRELGRLRA